jgi:CBS domain-containing protein
MISNSIASLLMRKKSQTVIAVAPTTTVEAAVRTMIDRKGGAVVVLEELALAGIVTERDVMVRVVGNGLDPRTTTVSEVMTAKVHSTWPGASVDEAFRIMAKRRERHLPVMENGLVCGVVSIGDVTHWLIEAQREQFDRAIRIVKDMGYANQRNRHG